MTEGELAAIKAAPADTTFRDVQALVAEVERLKHDADDAFYRLTVTQRDQAWNEVALLTEKLVIATKALEHIAEEGFDAYDRESAGEALTQIGLVRVDDG